MGMLQGGKTKERCLALGEGKMSFIVVPLFWGGRRGIQTTTSQQPPHLLCSLSPSCCSTECGWDRNLRHLMGHPAGFHLLNPFRVHTIPSTPVILQQCGGRISPADNLLLTILFSTRLVSANKADSSNHVIIP